MSDTRQTGATTEPASSGGPAQATGWLGWVVFTGIMMILIGGFHAMMGFVALFKDDYYLVASSGLVVSVDYTTWGWVHLILGGIGLLAGFGILAGQMWARVVGVILAAVSALANVAFLAAYPVWSVTIITVDVVVIYALCVHGREAKTAALAD